MSKIIFTITIVTFCFSTIAFCADGFFVIPVKGDSTVKVMKTGQTTSYATGDDGDLERGATIPTPRFTDNGNGTITDNLTMLTWLKNAYAAGVLRDWATALTDVAQLNTNGTMNNNNCGDTSKGGSHQIDWRLPNRNELLSLIDISNYDPALPAGHPFTAVQSDEELDNYYWSGTTYEEYPYSAWYVNMYDGDVGWINETNLHIVWPVRAGND